MSMKCKFCNYKMSTFEFLGCLTAEVFLILQERTKTRGISENWNQFMAGFSNKIKIPCSMCQKVECWLSGSEQTNSCVEFKRDNNDQININ